MGEAKIDANDIAGRAGPDGLARAIDAATDRADRAASDRIETIADIIDEFHETEAEPVVDGLFRQDEIVNLIAPSKVGKTMLSYNLACSVAAGMNFLGAAEWTCKQGSVVIIDNECKRRTIGKRMAMVCDAMGLDREILNNIYVVSLRGKETSVDIERGGKTTKQSEPFHINNMKPIIRDIAKQRPTLIILDALYRFLPPGVSENDNSAMAAIYTRLVYYLHTIKTAAMVVVHHTSKGEQGEKDVMSLGSGGGAMGRACDTHIVLREHEDDGIFVMDYRLRTFRQSQPVTLKCDFPVWRLADADPTLIKGRKLQKKATPLPPTEKGDDALFLSALSDTWESESTIRDVLRGNGYSAREAKGCVDGAKRKHKIGIIRPEEGTKCFGAFEVCKDGAALKFKLKGGGK
jgi:hypothetical protein